MTGKFKFPMPELQLGFAFALICRLGAGGNPGCVAATWTQCRRIGALIPGVTHEAQSFGNCDRFSPPSHVVRRTGLPE